MSQTIRGERFAPVPLDAMTPDQRRIAERILNGPRKSLHGAWTGLLRSAPVADAVDQLGEHVRFASPLPQRVRELVILVLAREWNAAIPWTSHYKLALKAGVSQQTIDRIGAGEALTHLTGEDRAAYDFVREWLDRHEISDAAYAAFVAAFGEAAVIELVGFIGYYYVLSMTMNIDRYPTTGFDAPPLPSLRKV